MCVCVCVCLSAYSVKVIIRGRFEQGHDRQMGFPLYFDRLLSLLMCVLKYWSRVQRAEFIVMSLRGEHLTLKSQEFK